MRKHRSRAHRLIPRSLTSHIILLLLAALVISHVTSLAILQDERREALRLAAREQAVERLAAVIRLLEETPPTLHDGVLRAASTPRLRFRIVDRTQLSSDAALRGPASIAHEVLVRRLDLPPDAVRVDFQDDWRRWHQDRDYDRSGDHDDDDWFDDHDRDDDDRHDDDRDHRAERQRPVLGPGMIAAIQLSDGRWIESITVLSGIDRPWGGPAFISLSLSAIGVVLIVTVLVRRAMRPVRRLSEAAEKTGRGETIEPLEESGPEDIRLLIRSFNTMRDRLDRYIRDRMTMLAAMSHDLRTPITTLRLRAELLDDGEDKASILATLDELQQMAEEVLSFIRTESQQEDTKPVDIGALVDSASEEVRITGGMVTFDPEGTNKIVANCRPTAMKRAIRNIIENAVRYGTQAEVSLSRQGGRIVITVNDNGPGIPEDRMAKLFEPFVRLETSRSRETGGVGLGLAIARSIVLSHGGTIDMKNRPEGGLAVTIGIPDSL